jgi:hypothetical protein
MFHQMAAASELVAATAVSAVAAQGYCYLAIQWIACSGSQRSYSVAVYDQRTPMCEFCKCDINTLNCTECYMHAHTCTQSAEQ